MRPFGITALALLCAITFIHATQTQEKKPMSIKRITPVLFVKEIEPIIPFWVHRLGFAKTIEVPDGNKLGFVTFEKGATEVMYQTYASVEKDAPPSMSAEARKGSTYLYIEVDNFEAVLASMKDVKIVMPVRTAFYGMKEFAVQVPGHRATIQSPLIGPLSGTRKACNSFLDLGFNNYRGRFRLT
jgi:uncharacterized glyoxalase superfamily protein PhnB